MTSPIGSTYLAPRPAPIQQPPPRREPAKLRSGSQTAKIVRLAAAAPLTAEFLVESLGMTLGAAHAMLSRLVKMGWLDRVARGQYAKSSAVGGAR